VHDSGNALDLTDDGLESFFQLFFLRSLHQVLGATKDHVHRRADLVRHAGSESPELCDPFGSSKLFFNPLTFGEIPEDDGIELLPLNGDLRNGCLGWKLFASCPESYDGSERPHLPARHTRSTKPLDMLPMRLAISRGDESIQRLSERFLTRTS